MALPNVKHCRHSIGAYAKPRARPIACVPFLVGHNAHFDLAVLRAANQRCAIKRNPLHAFSCLDTVTLGAAVYGETVLVRVARAAGLQVEDERLHQAIYDARLTATLFCKAINSLQPIFCANAT